MSVFNAKKYKLAKVICGDLELILKVVNLSLRGLEPYRPYTPVRRLIESLKEEKSILESHLEKQKKIKKEKGEEV